MALTDTQIEKLSVLKKYIEVLIAADSVLKSAENIVQPEAIDIDAFKTSARNQVLAGDGDKKDFIGTLSTEPIISKAEIVALGIDDKAADLIINGRDDLRDRALALIK